jgi:SIR2-like domain
VRGGSGVVRRAAAAEQPDSDTAVSIAADDPEAWWASNGDGKPLGYSNLLAALAPSPAARRGLLAGFFEPTAEDIEAGLKVPGPAHRAIAEMVKTELIRVIVTTNFDRLIERALEDAGVPPQVISRSETAAGFTPLQHARITVLKANGDYADLEMRNTVEELEAYPAEMNSLFDRVFDEYGLVICGWSADWDLALVAALERVKQRRYPLYWDERSSRSETATRLLAEHSGVVVPVASADEFFTDLLARLQALERLSEAPLTTAMSVARLKQTIANPIRRVDVHDLVIDAADALTERIAAQPVHRQELSYDQLDDVIGQLKEDAMPLLHLLTTGVRHDRDRLHVDLWVECIQRLMQARARFDGAFQEVLEQLRHYPALLALRAAGVTSVWADRDDVLLRLLTRPTWRDPYRDKTPIPLYRLFMITACCHRTGLLDCLDGMVRSGSIRQATFFDRTYATRCARSFLTTTITSGLTIGTSIVSP